MLNIVFNYLIKVLLKQKSNLCSINVVFIYPQQYPGKLWKFKENIFLIFIKMNEIIIDIYLTQNLWSSGVMKMANKNTFYGIIVGI